MNHIQKADTTKAQALLELKDHTEASSLFEKAGTQYGLGGEWVFAGDCFQRAAEASMKIPSPHMAGRYYTKAAELYARRDVASAVKSFQLGIDLYVDANRLSMAAKSYKRIAELYEKDNQTVLAIRSYRSAANLYDLENQPSGGITCLRQAGELSVTIGAYEEAVEFFETVSKASVDIKLLAYNIPTYLLGALLSYIALKKGANDISHVGKKITEYRQAFPMFEGTHEKNFIVLLFHALEDGNFDAFRSVNQPVSISPWHKALLVKIDNRAG